MFVSKDKLRCHAEHKTVMCPEWWAQISLFLEESSIFSYKTSSKIVSAKNLARHRKQMHPAPDDNMWMIAK